MRPPFRVTPATLDVLEVLINADGPVHGYRITRQAGRPSGTVQPILDRLEKHGWVSSEREIRNPVAGRPPRRLHQLTKEGRRLGRQLLAERRSQGG